MSFNYNPKDAVECLAEGEYDAELTKVEEKVSKAAGNPMLEVTWTVMQNGRAWTVRDYIVQPSGLFKLKMIARAWGKLDEFEAATFDLAAHTGKVARLYLTVQQSDGYADKNQVNSVKATIGMPVVTSATAPEPAAADSDIPF